MRYQEFKLTEYTDLNKEKKDIIAKISGYSADSPEQAEILDRIYKIINKGQIGTNIDTAFAQSMGDENQWSKGEGDKVRQEVARIIASVETDYKTLSAFIKRMESKGGVVNIAELSKPLNTFQSVFGDAAGSQAFNALAGYGVGKKQKGPGEYALAVLSNKIKLASGEGDLEIEGIGKVELKAAMSKSGGRIGYGGGSQKAKTQVLETYRNRIPTVLETLKKNAGGSLGIKAFMTALNIDMPIAGAGVSNPEATPQENQSDRRNLMKALISMDMDSYTDKIADKIATSEDVNAILETYLVQNFLWYRNRDKFNALLVMGVATKKTSMMRNETDLLTFKNSGHAASPDGFGISIIPTQAGAGREQWAQLSLNNGIVS